MITIRKSNERGHADHGWLDSYHTFSFADYHDPKHMGFRSLRVINEDFVAPGQGFGMHPHRDMEIITYVLKGAIEHRDSMGNGEVVQQGEIQYMSAGTGVQHSEFNPSATEPVHLLQIWIMPERKGLTPRYAQKRFRAQNERLQGSRLLASSDGRDESVVIQQDASIHSIGLDAHDSASHILAAGRYAWVQITRGQVTLNGHTLDAGDAAAISDESTLELHAERDAEVLLFDLA